MKPWQGKTVVIVDDSAQVREELRVAFEAVGMSVAGFAENGVVALDLVNKHRPYLVSLDVIMPEMDGIECYKKLKAAYPEQKIVMISWIGNEAKILDNLKDIIPPHLFQAKPVAAAELENRLNLIHNPPALGKPGIKSTLDEDAAMMDLGVKVS